MEKGEQIDANLIHIDGEINLPAFPAKEDLSKKGIQKLIENGTKPTKKQKQLGIKYGFIQLAGVEAAKTALKKNGYNLAELLQQHPEWNEHREQLTIKCKFAGKNDKHKVKMAGMVKTNDDEEEIVSQVQFNSMFVQQLQGVSIAEQLIAATELNKKYPTAFYQFLLDSTNNDLKFLQTMSSVMESTILEAQQLRIFLGICGLYNGKSVTIPVHLYQPMLQYLTTKPDISANQVGGFMKLCFQNAIGVSVATSIPTITKFDTKFAGNFDQFYYRLQLPCEYSRLIFKALPKTCLILSIPMILALQDEDTFAGIHPSHLQNFLTVMVYSFPTDGEMFTTLVDKFKDTTIVHIERMDATEFNNFLEKFALCFFTFHRQWFRNQQAVHQLLMGVLAMIDSNKVPGSFANELCQSLLDGITTVDEYLERPTQLSQDCTDSAMENLLKQIEECNLKATYKQLSTALTTELTTSEFEVFRSIGIELTLIQKMFFNICSVYQQIFLCTGAGTGKTTFLCGLAVHLAATTKQPVLFLNSNKNLRYRDCQRVKNWIMNTSANSKLTVAEYIHGERLSSIIFLSPEQILAMDLPAQFHAIFDEAQYIIACDTIELIQLLQKATFFVGVTGSPITEIHKEIIQMVLPDSLVVQFPDPYKFNCIDRPALVCNLALQWNKEIKRIMQEERYKAPVLLIMSKQQLDSCRNKYKHIPWLIFLDKCTQPEFKIALDQQFAFPLNDNTYKCFAVGNDDGVGVDYPSSPQIEHQGGIRVIICFPPKSTSDLQQFKRRTARMANQGVVYQVYHDVKNAGSINYHQTLKKKLKENEQEELKKLKISLRKALGRGEIEIDEEGLKEAQQFQKKFKQQLNIQDKQNVEMEDEEVKQIDIASQKQKMQVHDICKDGCGRSIHIGGCQAAKKADQMKINTFALSQRLPQYQEQKDNPSLETFSSESKHQDQTKKASKFDCMDCGASWDKPNWNCMTDCTDNRNEAVYTEDMDISKNKFKSSSMEEFVVKAVNQKIQNQLSKEIKINNSKVVQERRKVQEQYEAQGDALVQIIIQKLGSASLDDFHLQLCNIYGVSNRTELSYKLRRMYNSREPVILAAQDFLEKYDQLIAGQDAKNNEVLQSQTGKKTNKRITAPQTKDEDAITPRTIQKTSDSSNVYQELREQGKQNKFVRGDASSFGFQNKEGKEGNSFVHSDCQREQVQELPKSLKSTQDKQVPSLQVDIRKEEKQSKRTKKIIGKNQNVEKEIQEKQNELKKQLISFKRQKQKTRKNQSKQPRLF